MLYKIGEFSKLTNVPIKTLRYYDEINLFKPQEIDLFSGYRYYSKEQIEDLIKKIIIILIPIICIIGVVFISENKYIDKNSQTFTHLKIIDKTKEENIACNTALEQFYEDKEYIYYFPCEKSKYVIVIYSNGYQETVKSSLEYGDITIEDLEKNNIEFIKQKKDMSN